MLYGPESEGLHSIAAHCPAVVNARQSSKEHMTDPANSSKPGPTESATEEARMRQALGLRDSGGSLKLPQRREADSRGRRFVKDGEVPVVVLNAAKDPGVAGQASAQNRVAAVEAALRAERAAHERTEQALKEALSAVERLETKLAHAELAHGEALAAERASRESAERARDEAVAAKAGLEARLAELTAMPTRARGRPAADADTPARGRRKAAPANEREPQPVKWWLPSYRAKLRKK